MAKHRTYEEKLELSERARSLRDAGLTRREIQQELEIGEDLAKAFLRGVPLPESRRVHVKRAERQAAVAMRRAGASYNAIAAELGVSKGTLSVWLREQPAGAELPTTTGEPVQEEAPASVDESGEGDDRRGQARRLRVDGLVLASIATRLGVSVKTVYYWTLDLPVPAAVRPGGDDQHMDMMRRRYWDRLLAEREDERARIHAEHRTRVMALTEREIELLAVTAYWCEGCKSKTYDRREQVTFINSDPGLILLFVAWLDQLGFPREHRDFSLSIHESADVAAATSWWADVIGVPADSFGRPQLKRHNPKTVRKNVEQAYVGCLVVRLRQCRTLYQRIDGVWQGIMGALPQSSTDDHSRVV